MLLMWLTLPGRNEEGTQDVANLATDLNLGTITNQFSGCTTGTDVILQCVDKLLVSLHAIHISDQLLCTNEELGASGPIINGWGV